MKPYGVTVHILEPGFFRTEITNKDKLFRRLDMVWNRLTPEEREEFGDEYFSDRKFFFYNSTPRICVSCCIIVSPTFLFVYLTYYKMVRR